MCDSEEVLGCDESAISDSSATENDGNCNYLSEAPGGFDFTPTPSSATMYGYVTIDGLNATGLDWIGAFTPEGICAGATSLFMYEGKAYINMTIYGDDATTLDVQEGVGSNGSFLLKLYDASTSVVLNLDDGIVLTGWYNTNVLPGTMTRKPNMRFYPSCDDESAYNFDANSLTNDGYEYPEAYYDCDGECVTDLDEDGVCDEIDECIGELDECGVCNGPGPLPTVVATTFWKDNATVKATSMTPCSPAVETAKPMPTTTTFVTMRMNVSASWMTGICNGPGAIYECGCEHSCRRCVCDGNQVDALNVCGGDCLADVNDNAICDSQEESGYESSGLQFQPAATLDDGSCESSAAMAVCLMENWPVVSPTLTWRILRRCTLWRGIPGCAAIFVALLGL